MITGRKTKKVYTIYADEAFINSQHDDLMKASGFCGMTQDSMNVDGRELYGLFFASSYEAESYAESHGSAIFVDGKTKKPTIDHLKKEMPVFSDWYSNPEFRKWWKSKPDAKLDVVKVSFDDFRKMNDAFDDAHKRKAVNVDSIVAEPALPNFTLAIEEYSTWEFKRDGDDLLVNQFHTPDKFGRVYGVGRFRCRGLKEGEELKEEHEFLDPYMPDEAVAELGYTAAWNYVIVNWFVKNLPAYVRKTSRKVNPKQKPSKKKKSKQKPLEVVWRDEYEVDLKETTRQALHREIKCLCWGVRGHVRHYKDGREIFIKPYRKGKERDNQDAYVAKTYRKQSED